MKIFVISITDKENYTGEMKTKAPTKAAAMSAARLYIKQWQLSPATINYCKEVTQ